MPRALSIHDDSENVHPGQRHGSKSKPPSGAGVKRRALGESSKANTPADKPEKPKPTRTRSALAPLADDNQRSSSSLGFSRTNVAHLPRLKSDRKPTSAPSASTRGTRPLAPKPSSLGERSSAVRVRAQLRDAAGNAARRAPPELELKRKFPPKTPVEQIGRAGAVRAALLAQRYPVNIPEPVPPRRVQRSISVHVDEASAAPNVVDRAYAPSPKRSRKADKLVGSVFGGAQVAEPVGLEDFSVPSIKLSGLDEEPPSPGFGGDEFRFDLV